ncbi:MAG: hypothetical protein AAFY99_13970, partial [Pseudomonadota bacterium]
AKRPLRTFSVVTGLLDGETLMSLVTASNVEQPTSARIAITLALDPNRFTFNQFSHTADFTLILSQQIRLVAH